METEMTSSELPSAQQDKSAVAAVRGGDAERYRELVERHERRVYAVAWSRLGDAELAEEVTQAAFLRAYRRLWLLGDGAKFAGWVKAVSGNGNAIAADALGNCYLAGHCFNGATFDNITLTTGSSSYADVLVAKLGFPPVKVLRNGNQLTSTWTTNVTGFALESVTNSPAGTNWTAVTNTPARVGDQFTVTNSISGTNKFYRLRE
jgi:hypothetical protein